MTWTYSGNPASSARDAVRFLVGDTDVNDQKISDEEISWLVSEAGSNVYLAASASAESIGSSFSRKARTKTVGALSISYAARAEEYRGLADRLRKRAASKMTLAVYSGGISKADKDLNEQDTDWDRPSFERGLHDFVDSGRVDTLGYPVV